MSLQVALPTTPANLMKNVADNKNIFTRKFIDGFGFKDKMTVMYDSRDIVPLPRVRTTSFLRPGRTGTWAAAANTVAFSAREAQLRPSKGDAEITELAIESLWNSYMGQMYMKGSKTSQRAYITETPFENIIIEQLIARANQDYRMRTAFRGSYNAAGANSASIDNGLIAKMTAEFGVDIPFANLVGTAMPNATNMVAITQAIIDLITAQAPEYINEPLQMWMNPQLAKFYSRNCMTAYGINHSQWEAQFEKKVLFDQPNIEIVPEVGMSGSNRIFVTPKENLVFCADSQSLNIKFHERIRDWQVALDFKSTLDFCEGELIWSNTLA